jgi:hypothetical protein
VDGSQRNWHSIPRALLGLLAALLVLQITWRLQQDQAHVAAPALPAPPALAISEGLAFGDPPTYARLLLLWLLAQDRPGGRALAWQQLDYAGIEAWLARCLALDPRAPAPLLVASRLYGDVPDPARSARMLDFVAEVFGADPASRWPWLAHAVYVAAHRLHDRPRALRYAHALARDDVSAIPSWARQMEIFVLENMGEVQAAKVLLGGLLASGRVTDPRERRFLTARLAAMEAGQ